MRVRRRALAVTIALALAGALASAAWLSPQPTYDPWSWAVWGRELAHGTLDTRGGPSWKPLPAFILALLSPLRVFDDSAPAAAWVLLVRFHALLGLFVVGLLALQLATPSRSGPPTRALTASYAARLFPGDRCVPAAAVLAPLVLVGSGDWLRYFAAGNEVLPAAFLAATAALALLVNRTAVAAASLFLLALLRPEALPVLLACAVVLSRPRIGIVLCAVAAAAWTVPEWLGSGDPLGAFRQAASRPPWAASAAEHPVLHSLRGAAELFGPAALVGCAVTVIGLAWRKLRACGAGHGRDCHLRDESSIRRQATLATLVVAWIAAVALSTAFGFSGNARYYAPALPLVAALAAIGWSLVVGLFNEPGARFAAISSVAVLSVASCVSDADRVRARLAAERELGAALAQVAHVARFEGDGSLRRPLERSDPLAVARALVASRRLAVERPFQPHAAYLLELPIAALERPPSNAEYTLYRGPFQPRSVRSTYGVREPAKCSKGLGAPVVLSSGEWLIRRSARPAASVRGARRPGTRGRGRSPRRPSVRPRLRRNHQSARYCARRASCASPTRAVLDRR